MIRQHYGILRSTSDNLNLNSAGLLGILLPLAVIYSSLDWGTTNPSWDQTQLQISVGLLPLPQCTRNYQILVLGSSWFSLLGHCSGEERLKSSTDSLQSRNFLIKELCPVAYRGDHQGGELHQVLRLLWLSDQQLKPRLKATQQRIFTTKDWSQELLDVSHTSAPIPKTAEDLRRHLDYFVTIFPAEVRI